MASTGSWFSIGSFSNFQAGGIIDPRAMNRAPRVSDQWLLRIDTKNDQKSFIMLTVKYHGRCRLELTGCFYLQAHSLSSRGKLRGKGLMSSSLSTHSVKSWNCPLTNHSQAITKSESLNNRRNLAASHSTASFNNNHISQLNPVTIRPSMSLNEVPLSPNSIDER